MARLIFMIEEISRKLSKDDITGYAAQSCFYIVLSFFPCLLLIMSLIRFLPVDASTLIEMINNLAPSQLAPLLTGIVNDLYTNSSFTFTFVTILGALWAAGKGFLALIKGFDQIYEVRKQRNWLILRSMSIVYTIIFIVVIIATLLFIVFGNQLLILIQSFAPGLASLLSSILNNRLIFFPCILLLLFIFMYRFIPNRKSSIAREFPGALISALGWYLFSFFYSLYVNHSPNFSIMYGSLTTMIFALVWIYSCMVILFFGAEFNTFIDKKYLTPLFGDKKNKDSR